MARYFEPTPEQVEAWAVWVAECPDAIRQVAEQFNPWTLYRISDTGQRVTIRSLSEDNHGRVTISVNITAQFNLLLYERTVFGIDPDRLTECDLPDSTEPLGALMSEDDVNNNIDALRIMVRPDLWCLDDQGKAVDDTEGGP